MEIEKNLNRAEYQALVIAYSLDIRSAAVSLRPRAVSLRPRALFLVGFRCLKKYLVLQDGQKLGDTISDYQSAIANIVPTQIEKANSLRS